MTTYTTRAHGIQQVETNALVHGLNMPIATGQAYADKTGSMQVNLCHQR